MLSICTEKLSSRVSRARKNAASCSRLVALLLPVAGLGGAAGFGAAGFGDAADFGAAAGFGAATGFGAAAGLGIVGFGAAGFGAAGLEGGGIRNLSSWCLTSAMLRGGRGWPGSGRPPPGRCWRKGKGTGSAPPTLTVMDVPLARTSSSSPTHTLPGQLAEFEWPGPQACSAGVCAVNQGLH